MKNEYFLDVHADGEYIWRDKLNCLPAQMKSQAKQFLKQKRFAFANKRLKIVVRSFLSEGVVFDYERQISQTGA